MTSDQTAVNWKTLTINKMYQKLPERLERKKAWYLDEAKLVNYKQQQHLFL